MNSLELKLKKVGIKFNKAENCLISLMRKITIVNGIIIGQDLKTKQKFEFNNEIAAIKFLCYL